MKKTKSEKEFEAQQKEWELSILPIEDWVKEEGIELGTQVEPQKPIPLIVKREPEINLDAVLSQVAVDDRRLTNTRFAGNNRDLVTLLSGFEVLQEELKKFNVYTLTDNRNLERYEALVRESVDVFEGIKQHHIDKTNGLMQLEEESYEKLGQKKATIDEENKRFEQNREVYRQIRVALDSGKANGDSDRLMRAESQLYATLVQQQRRISSTQKSYEADRSVNRVLNVACGNGKIAVENLTNLQRTLLDNLAMQVSALGMGTMVSTMQEVDLSEALESGWNVVEYLHKTVDGMQPGFNTDAIYNSITGMSERAQEIDRNYRTKFGNGEFT